MVVRGHMKNGQVLLDEPVRAPEGAEVQVRIATNSARITSPAHRQKLAPIKRIDLPGPALAEDIIRDRR